MNIIEKIDKYLNESKKSELENLIRDNLSGTDRKVTKESLFTIVKNQMKNVNKKLFDKIFYELEDEGFLIKTKDDKYIWEQ